MATVVISYARADQPLIRAVVKLLRVAMREFEDPVYWDEDFEPGEAWREQFKRSVDCTPQLFVFWCAHSATSRQVAEEFQYALDAGRRVVPILLDKTELVPELGRIQGVDLRGAVKHRSVASSDRTSSREAGRPPLPPATSRPIPSAPRPIPRVPSNDDDVTLSVPTRQLGARVSLLPFWLSLVVLIAITAALMSPVPLAVVAIVTLCAAAISAWIIIARSRRQASRARSEHTRQAPPAEVESARWGRFERERVQQEAVQSIDADELLRAFRRDLRSSTGLP